MNSHGRHCYDPQTGVLICGWPDMHGRPARAAALARHDAAAAALARAFANESIVHSPDMAAVRVARAAGFIA